MNVQMVGERQCGPFPYNHEEPKAEPIQKIKDKILLCFLSSRCSKDTILLYAELCKSEWTSHVMFNRLVVPDFWDAGISLRNDEYPCTALQLLAHSQALMCPGKQQTGFFLFLFSFCMLCSSQWDDFLIFVWWSGKAFIFPSVTQTKPESLGEKSLPSDSSSVICEE